MWDRYVTKTAIRPSALPPPRAYSSSSTTSDALTRARPGVGHARNRQAIRTFSGLPPHRGKPAPDELAQIRACRPWAARTAEPQQERKAAAPERGSHAGMRAARTTASR